MLLAKLVGPGNTLIAGTKGEGTLATITTDESSFKVVRLRTENRRVGAVLVTELRVDGNAIEFHVAVVVRSTRVALWASQVHVTGDQALTDTVNVGKVSGLRDTAAGDHVSINDLVSRVRSRRILLRDRSRCGCRVCHRLCERCDQRQRQCSSSHGCTATTCDVLSLHVFPLQGSIVPRSPTPTFRRRAEQST